MPRIKLIPLEEYIFSVTIKVRITDLNYGGHLGNDTLLSMVHEARVAFLARFGFTEKNCGGAALIIADTAVVYQGEAFAHDQLLFEVGAGEPTTKGFRLFFRVSRLSDQTSIALVENGMVCYDYVSRTTQTLPPMVKVIFGIQQ